MKSKVIFIMALLVVGNLIGAGILALPIQTGGAGLVFAAITMIILCGAMFFSASTLASEAVEAKTDNFNYPTLYQQYLGKVGKWIAIIANMLILYGLLTAYLSGGTAIIMGAFSINSTNTLWQLIVVLLLFAGLSAFTMCGTKIIARYNGLLMIILGITFVVIVIIAGTFIKPERTLFLNLKFIPVAVPVILTAFHFHNIIPSISRHLDWDLKSIRKAMGIGMGIGFIMNFIWVTVGIGVLPLALGKHSIVYAFEHGLPGIVPISQELNIHTFSFFAAMFALTAICTSYVANGMGLMDFNKDLLVNSFGKSSKILLFILTFVPPLGIAVFFPNVFLKAIGVVGGVGIAILFGMLPAILFFKKAETSKGKILAVVMLLLFFSALCFDLLNDFGIINSSVIAEDIKIQAQTEKIK